MQSPTLPLYVKKDFFKRLFKTIEHTDEGLKAREEISDSLKKLEEGYPQMIENNPERAKEVLNKIGGNVFLLSSFDFALLAKIDEELSNQINQAEIQDDGSDGTLFWSLIYFDTFSDTFDSSYDSIDTGGFDAGSGCGGDSGCSGCSGCGGCGGCGG